MGTVNKVILLGRLGRDMEVRSTPGGDPVGNFTMATNETWADKGSGERKEKTEWHRIVIWGKRAKSLEQYLTKGTQVYIEGRLQTREWEDKAGNKRSTTEVKLGSLEFIGGRTAEPGTDTRDSSQDQRVPSPDNGAELTEDDIPF